MWASTAIFASVAGSMTPPADFFLRSGACAGGVLVCAQVIMESTLISQLIRPDASARSAAR